MQYVFTIFLSILLTFNSLLSPAQEDTYSRTRIYTDAAGIKTLLRHGIPVDHGELKKGVYLESDFSNRELQIITQLGFQYDILIEDVTDFYAKRALRSEAESPAAAAGTCFNSPAYPTPSNFTTGSMGGFYKYSEFIAHIDNMYNLFPNLITQKQPIGTFTTNNGYPIYWIKISDNPSVNENEPEILFTAVHHAREPEGLTQMIFFMYYLLEHYGSDPEITYLIDHVQIYFIPMVNPDGYTYNETNFPNGGGMWRKNRRNNGGGEFGVDLNRNYGYHWGYDNQGSSPDSSSNTYRGPWAFSEEETQAVKYFMENRNIRITLNYHTFGNLLIYPWGYDYSIFTPDSALYVEWATLMTKENYYAFGTGDQTVGYITNGDSDDWMYGEQNSKPKDMPFTPEVGNGNDGFWPAQNRIIPLCSETMLQNMMMLRLVLKYAHVSDTSPALISQQTGYFHFNIKCLGLDTPASFTVSITPLGNEITNIGSAVSINNMSLLESRSDSIAFALNGNLAQGQQFKYLLSVNNGNFTYSDTVTKYFGNASVIFTDNGNSMNNWASSGWDISTAVYHSPTASITDSPNGNYSNNSSSFIQLANPVSLSNSLYAALHFWARWEIEPGYDYVELQASNDNGNTWSPLCGQYTKPGSPNQDQDKPLYDGFQLDWIYETVNLNDYLGQDILLRFKLVSDWWTKEDGFYFDDMLIETILNSGIREAKPSSLHIFPNPASDIIYINITGRPYNSPYTLVIKDIIGREVMRKENISRSSTKIDISKVPSGVYCFEISGNDIFETRKILINK